MIGWSMEDHDRLLAEAMAADDQKLVGRILMGDEFEPSVVHYSGLVTLLESKADHAKRIARYREEWARIKARWERK
jgi:hypothetical protein